MSGFSLEWLRLREPVDHVARSAALTARLKTWCSGRSPLRVVDLGCGTGSSFRYLAPRLSGEQDWLLIDNVPELLGAIPAALSAWAELSGLRLEDAGESLILGGGDFTARCRILCRDLAHDLTWRAEADADLVTAAALLDLVSWDWLSGPLAEHCRGAGAALLAPLTYNGAAAFQPGDRADAAMLRLVNLHQATDKGFGPALGPRALAAATRTFRAAGYTMATAPSTWRLGPDGADLQRMLIEDWARAALDASRGDMPMIDGWRRRRLALLDRGTSYLTVDHCDLLALPPA